MINKTKHINYLYTIKVFPAQNALYSTKENPIAVDQKLNCVHECKQNINQMEKEINDDILVVFLYRWTLNITSIPVILAVLDCCYSDI